MTDEFLDSEPGSPVKSVDLEPTPQGGWTVAIHVDPPFGALEILEEDGEP